MRNPTSPLPRSWTFCTSWWRWSRPQGGAIAWKASSPKAPYRRHWSGEAGTSLIEVLAALVITGLLVGLFLPFVAQTLTRWTAGVERSERSDQVLRAAIRLQADFSAAASLDVAPRGAQQASLAFGGNSQSCWFVRAVPEGLGVVLQSITLSLDESAKGAALIRRSAPFDPDRFGRDPRALEAAVAVISGGYRMHFNYVSRDGTRTDIWTEAAELPARVELSIRSLDGRDPIQAPLSLIFFNPPQRRHL